MDRMRLFLDEIKHQGVAQGNFLGLLNVLIGRRIRKTGGPDLTTGLTWRELAALLKKVRWDKEAVRELGLEPASLPPRDRQRYWYTAIVQARVDSPAAFEAGDRLAQQLSQLGYEVGPGPGGGK